MPSRDAGLLVLWPHYFDRELSRRHGRRVPSDLAIERPRAQDLAQACRSLGLKPELLEDAKPPRHWYTRSGCVVLPKGEDSKESILKQVARRL